jgi:hypothetical protein
MFHKQTTQTSPAKNNIILSIPLILCPLDVVAFTDEVVVLANSTLVAVNPVVDPLNIPRVLPVEVPLLLPPVEDCLC